MYREENRFDCVKMWIVGKCKGIVFYFLPEEMNPSPRFYELNIQLRFSLSASLWSMKYVLKRNFPIKYAISCVHSNDDNNDEAKKKKNENFRMKSYSSWFSIQSKRKKGEKEEGKKVCAH